MQTKLKKPSGNAGFTIAEMVICFAIVAITIGGMITAYSNANLFVERSGYALAAQAQAVQVLERARAALWDSQTVPITDLTTLVPTNTVTILELPITGTNVIYCTNVLTITTVTNNNPVCYFKIIQVASTWLWNHTVMSNTVVAYRAPDQ